MESFGKFVKLCEIVFTNFWQKIKGYSIDPFGFTKFLKRENEILQKNQRFNEIFVVEKHLAEDKK